MKTFRILLWHELRMLLISHSTYIAGVLFLVLLGLIYWVVLKGFTLTPQEETLPSQFYRVFWIPVFFVVPLLTMRSLAEERRAGTLESLLTTRASSVSVVLSKYFAAYLLYLGLWICTLAFPLIALQATSLNVARQILLDGASLPGALTFIALSGSLFIAVGIFASSISRSQLVAGMLCFTILFLIVVGSRLLMEIPPGNSVFQMLTGTIEYLQAFQHFLDFSQGVVDTRPFVYYLSLTVIFLFFATLMVERRK
jgi:ABC-2 type transport system permease protein